VEAQRDAVARYLNGGRWKLVAEYVEVESGKRNSRPQLQAAISHAKATGAKLVIELRLPTHAVQARIGFLHVLRDYLSGGVSAALWTDLTRPS
jgi:DNA invertase Pin-like site-specific DNA recombinase